MEKALSRELKVEETPSKQGAMTGMDALTDGWTVEKRNGMDVYVHHDRQIFSLVHPSHVGEEGTIHEGFEEPEAEEVEAIAGVLYGYVHL